MSQQMERSWWGRNWKWFVPAGCLGILMICAGFVTMIMVIVFGAMKSSDAYKEAVAKARAFPAVQEALGSPIEEGLVVTGNINVSGPSGEAKLAIPLSGPNGKGTLYLEAVKSAGEWNYSTLEFEVRGSGERISLLE